MAGSASSKINFGFNLRGSAGSTVVVESSTNLSYWVSLATEHVPQWPALLQRSQFENFPWRFFRARLQ